MLHSVENLPVMGLYTLQRRQEAKFLADAGTPYSLENMRKICVKLGLEATADFRSIFKNGQETAMKIPRSKV